MGWFNKNYKKLVLSSASITLSLLASCSKSNDSYSKDFLNNQNIENIKQIKQHKQIEELFNDYIQDFQRLKNLHNLIILNSQSLSDLLENGSSQKNYYKKLKEKTEQFNDILNEFILVKDNLTKTPGKHWIIITMFFNFENLKNNMTSSEIQFIQANWDYFKIIIRDISSLEQVDKFIELANKLKNSISADLDVQS